MPRKTPSTALPAPLIEDVSPMLLSERKTAPHDESEWIAEIKYDGYRVMAQFGERSCTLKSRNGANCTKWFPEVSEALASLDCGRMVVDGEMCVLDEVGRTDFDALHNRAMRKTFNPGDPIVTYCVFDLLVLDGLNIMSKPLIERKALLQQLMSPAPPHLLYAGHIDSDSIEHPVSWLYNHALSLQLEGVVGKKRDSIYLPGERNSTWFKLKRPGATPPGRFHRKRS